MKDWDETKVIPFNEAVKAIRKMKPATDHRVMFSMMFLTGCRRKELDYMKKTYLLKNILYWNKGKNQKGLRKEKLPPSFISELEQYWQNRPTLKDKMFAISSNTFSREFNRDIRPLLGENWIKKKEVFGCNLAKENYIYQLCYLRKDFFTKDNHDNYERYRSLEIALYMTQKRMGHHSAYMTQIHYMQNYEALEMDKYRGKTIAQIYESELLVQHSLLDFFT